MKKLFKSLVVLCLMTSMLVSGVSVVNAEALPGEVMQEVKVPLENYDGTYQYQNAKVVVPEQFAHLNLYPVITRNGAKYTVEDVVIDGVTYKWLKTVDGTVDEYVLMKTGEENPFYEPDETKRIDYSERYIKANYGVLYSGINPYYGKKDASQIKVYIDGTTRSFKSAFYPQRVLINHAANITNYDSRIFMVSIREFVNSLDYMSLVWDNGRIIVSNSKTGKDTVFSIYDNKVDLKAVLINGTSYASLDDLIIAQISYDEFYKYHVTTRLETDHLGYYEAGGYPSEFLPRIYRAYSEVGCMIPYLLERFLPPGVKTSGTAPALVDGMSWVPYTKEGSLSVFNMLETSVNPEGCIYDGDVQVQFSITNDLGYWKSEMLKVTSKYSSDRDKAYELAKFLQSKFFHVGLANSGYNADRALNDNYFVGLCADTADLYCMGLGQAGIPSVVINGKVHNSHAGHAINGVYYNGAWHYYDIQSYLEVSKDHAASKIYADAIWGLTEADDRLSDEDFNANKEINLRNQKMGYSRVN